jgi:hypothetical protein
MVQIKATYKYTLHFMACVPHETKQNKTKQALVIVRVSWCGYLPWLLFVRVPPIG